MGANPLGAAIGDFNLDGQLDLVTANVGGNTVSVLLHPTAAPAPNPGADNGAGGGLAPSGLDAQPATALVAASPADLSSPAPVVLCWMPCLPNWPGDNGRGQCSPHAPREEPSRGA